MEYEMKHESGFSDILVFQKDGIEGTKNRTRKF